MKYCSRCGGQVGRAIPDGDTHERHVCPECGEVFYSNPKMVVGTLPVWDGRILLCRRAIPPQVGLWTLPAGFLESGEAMAIGATREAHEEANARIEVDAVLALYDLSHIDQVQVFFRARLLDPGEGRGRAGDDGDPRLASERSRAGLVSHLLDDLR